jgi:hypothetical protein
MIYGIIAFCILATTVFGVAFCLKEFKYSNIWIVMATIVFILGLSLCGYCLSL